MKIQATMTLRGEHRQMCELLADEIVRNPEAAREELIKLFEVLPALFGHLDTLKTTALPVRLYQYLLCLEGVFEPMNTRLLEARKPEIEALMESAAKKQDEQADAALSEVLSAILRPKEQPKQETVQ